ncbi:hypothetical protein R1sor_010545 [Riccia sorocarpa]|uniref:Reverse transcriptase domain-containing protein n=1 Tax=Riccia sorocarpa TaxID=122646 RepID=A0ABD3I4F5_9MARC
MENKEADIWKARSRIKWARKGDAPTRYYFALTKARFRREMITKLEAEDGRIVEMQKEIVQSVGSFYKTLYTNEPETEETKKLRSESLALIDKRVTQEENRMMEVEPDLLEVEETIEGMQKEKAPGLDGVTVEVVSNLWDEIKDDCMMMMRFVWSRKSISERDSKGVIKLLPKNEETHRLKNWRPITLMPFTYKLVAKIIANRMQKLIPKLVDSQQSGFVVGRNITDTVLALKIGVPPGTPALCPLYTTSHENA